MRFEEVKNKEVIDTAGERIGRIIDIDFKDDGNYSFIVKGELDDVQKARTLAKFGVVEGTDTFEVPLKIVQGIGEKVVLSKAFDDLEKEITVIKQI